MSDRVGVRPPTTQREQIRLESLLLPMKDGFPSHTRSPGVNPPAGHCPELDCVQDRLPPDTIAAAEHRARAIGVTADRVLIASGVLTEEAYMRALALRLGLAFEPLEAAPRRACPLDDERLIEACAAGLLPVMRGDEFTLVLAPRGIAPSLRACRRVVGIAPAN